MFTPDQYQLLDFGDGRKLEQFGPYVLDRPSPSAEGARPRHPELWADADARYERIDAQRGRWVALRSLPEHWTIAHGALRLELKPTEFGHLGVFAEQADNWDWIARQVAAAGRPLRVLNLFAYTGGSTLAAASAGAEVVHLDAAKNSVQWARRNAELSQLAAAPIRWIAEDAPKFVAREVRRGNRYDAVILDPPSYGHGPKGEVWKLADALPALLASCAELTGPRPAFMLISAHSPGLGPRELAALVQQAWPALREAEFELLELGVTTRGGGTLPSGIAVRLPR